jgi:hypothetical protein
MAGRHDIMGTVLVYQDAVEVLLQQVRTALSATCNEIFFFKVLCKHNKFSHLGCKMWFPNKNMIIFLEPNLVPHQNQIRP